MTFLGVDPVEMAFSSGQLGGIAAGFAAANGVVAAPTTAILPANGHDASFVVAAAFGTHGALYQAVAAQAAAAKTLLAAMVGVSGVSYAATESFNAAAVV